MEFYKYLTNIYQKAIFKLPNNSCYNVLFALLLVICQIEISQTFNLPRSILSDQNMSAHVNKSFIYLKSGYRGFQLSKILGANESLSSKAILRMLCFYNLTKIARHAYIKTDNDSPLGSTNSSYFKRNTSFHEDDDFDYEYDDEDISNDEDTSGFQDAAGTAALFFVEIVATLYGLSYGIYAQINYFYHVNIIKDREPQHLGSFNNNITLSSP